MDSIPAAVSELQSPSPSHRRERSLDDIVYDSSPVTNSYYTVAPYNTSKPKNATAGAATDISPAGAGIITSSSNSTTEGGFGVISGRKKSRSSLMATNEQLQRALDYEESETIRLEKLLRQSQQKYDSALAEQNRLEQDIVNRDNQIELLSKQVKDMKKSKHELENMVTQEQMTYINEKQQWLDKEAEYEQRIQDLLANNKGNNSGAEGEAQNNNNNNNNNNSTNASASSASPSFGFAQLAAPFTPGPQHSQQPPHTPASVPTASASTSLPSKDQKVLDRMKNELDVTRQQLELVSKEYALRHEKVKQEMEQVRQLNSRLQEENEGFQVVLAQKTVLGGFSLADELEQVVSEGEEEQEDQESNQSDDQNSNRELTSRLYNLEFENKSFKNHNRALKLSLERLVQRLLEYRDFESVVEDNQQQITQRSISLFSRRVSSSSAHQNVSNSHHTTLPNTHRPLDIPKRRQYSLEPPPQTPVAATHSEFPSASSPRSAGSGSSAYNFGIYRGSSRALKPASTWSSMIFASAQTTNSASTDSAVSSTYRHNSTHGGLDSPISTTSSVTTGEVVSSSSSSSSCGSSIASVTTAATAGNMSSSNNNSDIAKSVLTGTTAADLRKPPATHGQKILKPLRLQSVESTPEAPLPSASSSSSSSWGFSFH